MADIEARFNGKAVAIECDISNLDALDALVSDAVAAFGRLDILVNNAVTTSINTLMDTTLEDFEKGLRVGPMATLRLMQLAQPHLLEAGDGNIINLATAPQSAGTAPPMACTRQRKKPSERSLAVPPANGAQWGSEPTAFCR